MKMSQKSEFNYSEMLDAIKILGFEQLELNFFRRVDNIDDYEIIIYSELSDSNVDVTVYKDSTSLDHKTFTDPVSFIDYIESTLHSHGIESVVLTPIDSSITINGQPIVAANDKLSTKELMKKMLRVKSSNLWSYAFQPKDFNKGTMLIQFKGPTGGPDDVYVYYDIPSKLWQKFVAAPSKGAFFWKHIRNIFKYGKLTGDKRTKLANGV